MKRIFYLFLFFIQAIQGEFATFDQEMKNSKQYSLQDSSWITPRSLYQSHISFINSVHKDNVYKNLLLRIPKTIHQIWLGSPFPERCKRLQQTWLDQHPDWEYILWDDAKINAFGLVNKSKYDRAVNFGEKSDIARYEILYRYGGLYVDTDFEALKPFDILHYCCDFYTGVGYDANLCIFNGLIGSVAGHPILRACVYEMNYPSHLNNDSDSIMNRSGPYFFTRCFNKYVGEGDYVNIAFPISFFYPWPASERRNNAIDQILKWTTASSFGIHHWHVSWR